MSTLITGLRLAYRYRPLLLIAFLANLLTAVPFTLFPAASLLQATDRPALRAAADGIEFWQVLELFLSPAASTLGLNLFLLALMPLISWPITALLKGGILLTYAETPTPFQWRRFWWGCWHWFGTFLVQGLWQYLAFSFVLPLLLFLAIFLVTTIGRWLTYPLALLLLFLCLLWLILMEYAAVLAVVQQRRNIFATFGAAFGLLFRRPLAIASLYLPALLLLLLLHVLYRGGIRPFLPLHWWPLVLLVQQSFIFGRLLLRLGRWAGGVTMVQSVRIEPLSEEPLSLQVESNV
jgi:hypothetical protein